MVIVTRVLMEIDTLLKKLSPENYRTDAMRTLIVIPCYNARSTLEDVIKRTPKEFRAGLLVVDDGSTDDTINVLEKNDIKFIRHQRNLGYGAAQKTGFRFAVRNGYDLVVILHADGQYPPEKIQSLISPIIKEEADIVSGSRMLKESNRREMPILRNVGNRFLSLLENLALGTSLNCYHCGFRAYSKKFLESVNFTLNSNGFEFDSEILFQAVSKGFRIKQIPIDAHYGKEISYLKPLTYGLSILRIVSNYTFCRLHITKSEQYTGRLEICLHPS